MNLYICSTLRHLLFSLLKASNEPDKKSHILFFYDYQDVDMNSIASNKLPEHITLTLLSRKKLAAEIQDSAIGKLYTFLALRCISLPPFLKKTFIHKLDKAIPNLMLPDAKITLFVFNERNKMSRLFRLLVSNYHMIEDGVGNYYEIPVGFPKNIMRALQGKKASSWVFGESKTCQSIDVVFPEKLPKSVRSKGHEIDFLNTKTNLDIINNVFKFTPSITNEDPLIIIATQPTSKNLLSRLSDPTFLNKVNQEIITYCKNKHIAVIMKTHPSENLTLYQKAFPDMRFLPTKYPLELQILNIANKPSIISINSSAGLGFEKQCSRLKLIEDEDLNQFTEIICSWEKDSGKLKNTIEKAFMTSLVQNKR